MAAANPGAGGEGKAPNGGIPPSYAVTHSTPPSSYYAPNFLRGVVLCGCLVLMALTIISIVGLINSGKNSPEFKLMRLSLENMNATGAFVGDWDAMVKARNPNSVSMSFTNFHVEVYYKDQQVGSSFGINFQLGKKEEKDQNMKAIATPKNPVSLDEAKLEEMMKEKNSGSITVSFRIGADSVLKNTFGDSRHFHLGARCGDVKLEFKNGNVGVSNNGEKHIKCKL